MPEQEMLIEIIDPAEHAPEIGAFLDQVASTNHSVLGYHYPFYLHMLQAIGVGRPMAFISRTADGSLSGYLPFLTKETEIGKVMCSLPFFGPNAGVICRKDEQIESALVTAMKAWAAQEDVMACTIYTPFDDDRAMERYKEWLPEALMVEKFTNYLHLQDLKLDNSLLYDLRKAERMGVTIETCTDAAFAGEVYDIYIRNCNDYGIPPKPVDCMRRLMEQSRHHSGTATYLARHEGKIIGALIMIYSPSTASYYLPCSIHEFRSLQPTTMLIHHAMKESITAGRRIWNWESSPSAESGVYKFKKKWGSLDGRYAIFTHARRGPDFFRSLGASVIAEKYPFFFVYPFHRL
jgi:hypothetical protein